MEMIGAGAADREISRRTGVPRATVGSWRRNPCRAERFRGGDRGRACDCRHLSRPSDISLQASDRLDWQLDLTCANPGALIRGLLHSDGCRSLNRFTTTLPGGRVATYEYPRYFFSNLSADIRAIFCDHCDLLGLRWTLSNPRNVSIAQRDSVARLDEFVGPKS